MNYSRQESHNQDIVPYSFRMTGGVFKVPVPQTVRTLLHIYIATEPLALSMRGKVTC